MKIVQPQTLITPHNLWDGLLAIALILVSISPVVFRQLLLLDWDFQSQVEMRENRLDFMKQTSSSPNH